MTTEETTTTVATPTSETQLVISAVDKFKAAIEKKTSLKSNVNNFTKILMSGHLQHGRTQFASNLNKISQLLENKSIESTWWDVKTVLDLINILNRNITLDQKKSLIHTKIQTLIENKFKKLSPKQQEIYMDSYFQRKDSFSDTDFVKHTYDHLAERNFITGNYRSPGKYDNFVAKFEQGQERKVLHTNALDKCNAQIAQLRKDFIQHVYSMPPEYYLPQAITFTVPGLSLDEVNEINERLFQQHANKITFAVAAAGETKITSNPEYIATNFDQITAFHENIYTKSFMETMEKENFHCDARDELTKTDPNKIITYEEKILAAHNTKNKGLIYKRLLDGTNFTTREHIINKHRNPFWDLLNDIYDFFTRDKNKVAATDSSSPTKKLGEDKNILFNTTSKKVFDTIGCAVEEIKKISKTKTFV